MDSSFNHHIPIELPKTSNDTSQTLTDACAEQCHFICIYNYIGIKFPESLLALSFFYSTTVKLCHF